MVRDKGTSVHPRERVGLYAGAISRALVSDLGNSHRAAKTIMLWTGASDRSAKYWLAGARGPDGGHLINLAKHSDAVLRAVLQLAEREAHEVAIDIGAAKSALLHALDVIEHVRIGSVPPRPSAMTPNIGARAPSP